MIKAPVNSFTYRLSNPIQDEILYPFRCRRLRHGPFSRKFFRIIQEPM